MGWLQVIGRISKRKDKNPAGQSFRSLVEESCRIERVLQRPDDVDLSRDAIERRIAQIAVSIEKIEAEKWFEAHQEAKE